MPHHMKLRPDGHRSGLSDSERGLRGESPAVSIVRWAVHQEQPGPQPRGRQRRKPGGHGRKLSQSHLGYARECVLTQLTFRFDLSDVTGAAASRTFEEQFARCG